MVTLTNFFDNPNIKEIASAGGIKVYEHQADLSLTPMEAATAYYSSKMNVRKRQVLIQLNNDAYIISAGAMQWTAGDVKMASNVKGVGDFLGKAFSGAVTKESAIKPMYKGNGLLMLEPTYKHILLEDVASWGGLVLDDGLFLACSESVKHKIVARSNLSSAVLGNEGMFNLSLNGQGIAVLESPVPREELVQVNLENDEVRIDGNFAIAWSSSLQFTVEKSSKSLIGSAVSGEGLVNVYRGSGRILMAVVH